MIFGNKSDLKNHLSAKHPTFSHKVMARGTYDQSVDPMHQKERSPKKTRLQRLKHRKSAIPTTSLDSHRTLLS
jgi:hypothetical protein